MDPHLETALSGLNTVVTAESRVLLTLYQNNNTIMLHHQLNLFIEFSLNSTNIEPMLNIIVVIIYQYDNISAYLYLAKHVSMSRLYSYQKYPTTC